MRTSLLIFELGGQRCALFAEDVVEVQRAVAMVRLPRCPQIVEGVIDVRGRLVPVLGVRSRFGLPPLPLTPSDYLIVARVAWRTSDAKRSPPGERIVAIRVDRALELLSVAPESVESLEPAVPGVALVAGLARLAGGLVLIHDLERFLSLDEAAALDQSLSEASER
jgi:purine-binding chemotaxis protein CheW